MRGGATAVPKGSRGTGRREGGAPEPPREPRSSTSADGESSGCVSRRISRSDVARTSTPEVWWAPRSTVSRVWGANGGSWRAPAGGGAVVASARSGAGSSAQPAPARSDMSRDLPTPWKPRTPTTVKSCCSNNCGITSSGVSAKLASRSLRGVSGGSGRAVEEEEDDDDDGCCCCCCACCGAAAASWVRSAAPPPPRPSCRRRTALWAARPSCRPAAPPSGRRATISGRRAAPPASAGAEPWAAEGASLVGFAMIFMAAADQLGSGLLLEAMPQPQPPMTPA